MKKYAIISLLAAACAFVSCEELSDKMSSDFPSDKMTHLEFSNGEVPFSPFAFEVPEGVVECEFDTDALPNELRIKGTDHVIAYFQNGEFSIPFQLDSKQLSYKYTFKEIK